MCLFFETIKIIDSEIYNLNLHQERFELTRKTFFKGCKNINLVEAIDVPKAYQLGIVKCKVIYNDEIKEIQFSFYQKKSIKSLKIVKVQNIEYNYKYLNRICLDILLKENKHYDDLIIVKNGNITDTSFTNLVFSDSQSQLFTPSTPLFKGIKRQKLLKDKIIKKAHIKIKDLAGFKKIYLINAMLDIGDISLDIYFKKTIF